MMTTHLQFRGSTKVRQPQSVMTGGPTRPPDLILQPCHEGMDFTMKLLGANRMSRVVEIQCFFDAEPSKNNPAAIGSTDDNGFGSQQPQQPGLTHEDVMKLFLAMSSTTEAFDDDDEHPEDDNVMDEYQHDDENHVKGGLPQLEALTIVCRNAKESTPSFIRYLAAFLRSSLNFPNFHRLTIHGVNLRGDVLDLRALAEAFRLHPSIRRVDMKQCFFSPSQQSDMAMLQNVFMEKEQLEQRSRRSSSSTTGPFHERQLVFGSQPAEQPQGKTTTNTASSWEPISVSKEIPLLGEKSTKDPWWAAWIDCCWHPLSFCCKK